MEIGVRHKVEKESDDRNTGDGAYHHQKKNWVRFEDGDNEGVETKGGADWRDLLPQLLSPMSRDNHHSSFSFGCSTDESKYAVFDDYRMNFTSMDQGLLGWSDKIRGHVELLKTQ